MTDGLPDGSTDKSDHIWTDGNFPGISTLGKFGPGILMGISTMDLVYGWTDRMDDGHTDRWMDFQVESHLG